jgi:hypothetical protein
LLFSELVERAVEQAVRLDAACAVVNLLSLPASRSCTANAFAT